MSNHFTGPKLAVFGIVLAISLWLPSQALANAKAVDWERLKSQLKIVKSFKELNLGQEKEIEVLKIIKKYSQERKDMVGTLRKHQEELKGALAAPNRDEEKVKGLVSSITAAQDELLTSFKTERDEAMALMNPIQQGQFLMILNQYQKIMKQ